MTCESPSASAKLFKCCLRPMGLLDKEEASRGRVVVFVSKLSPLIIDIEFGAVEVNVKRLSMTDDVGDWYLDDVGGLEGATGLELGLTEAARFDELLVLFV
jgi:hypothetical protein